ncbi:hypothetical protein [Los Azufres archaeal virus 1]|nr:hypothetical protein [Los Azufres archaeal virus 1]
MSYQPVLMGSYTLVTPQSVSVAASSSATVGSTTTVYGAGMLYVYIASLPSGVTASISIGGISTPLVAGLNQIPLPAGTTVGQITLSNSNSSAASVALWAFIVDFAQ